MTEWEDTPQWLTLLVRDVWGEPEWNAWETVWKRPSHAHGVSPDMLDPVGADEQGRPAAISASGPQISWRSAPIEWDAGSDQHAVLVALQRLAQTLEQEKH